MAKGSKNKHIDVNTQIIFDLEGNVFDPTEKLKELFEFARQKAEENRGKREARGSSQPEPHWSNKESPSRPELERGERRI